MLQFSITGLYLIIFFKTAVAQGRNFFSVKFDACSNDSLKLKTTVMLDVLTNL